MKQPSTQFIKERKSEVAPTVACCLPTLTVSQSNCKCSKIRTHKRKRERERERTLHSCSHLLTISLFLSLSRFLCRTNDGHHGMKGLHLTGFTLMPSPDPLFVSLSLSLSLILSLFFSLASLSPHLLKFLSLVLASCDLQHLHIR